ncbi:MAG: hypothetical protein M3011_07145 [Actinomycetota bacterium]|nr:hypothetical protein [Actinomycetota bacterium]
MAGPLARMVDARLRHAPQFNAKRPISGPSTSQRVRRCGNDNVGAGILAPDEHNVSEPLTGLGAGQGLVVVPATDLLVAYGSATVPGT